MDAVVTSMKDFTMRVRKHHVIKGCFWQIRMLKDSLHSTRDKIRMEIEEDWNVRKRGIIILGGIH